MSRIASWGLVVAMLVASACVPILGDFTISNDGAGGGAGQGGVGGVLPGEFALTVPTSVRAVISRSTTVPVEIVPASDFTDDITITVGGLPTTVTADPLTIPAGTTSGELVLTVADDATLAEVTATTVTALAGDISHDAPMELTIVGVPGTLDVTFGTDGVASDVVGSSMHVDGARVLSDGSVMLAADFPFGTIFVSHYTPDGALDMSYGTDGRTIIDPDGSGAQYPGFDAADDGSVVLAIRGFLGSDYERAFRKLRPDGQPDTAFGFNGVVQIDVSPDDTEMGPIHLLPDERFLAFRRNVADAPVYRYTASGLDDSGWTATSDFPPGFNPVRIGLVGSNTVAVCPGLMVARLTATGAPDSTFGVDSGGVYFATHDFGVGGTGTFNDFAAFENNIYVVGSVTPSSGSSSGSGIAAFTADGTPLATFGTGGATTLLFGSSDPMTSTTGVSIALDQEMYLVTLGSFIEDSVTTFVLARYGLDGQLDSNFGDQGVVLQSQGTFGLPVTVGHQPDGRLLVVGVLGQEVRIARYWP